MNKELFVQECDANEAK